MKSKKILVGVLSASGIAIALPAITSCAKTNNTNEPEVSSRTPKVRDVGAKSTRTYFLITQSNIKNPEDTKVKIVNLKVNGADAQPVAGLITSYPDSAGNILVVFNMALAQKQYQAEDIAFDLKLTNKTANTEYVIRGFEVKAEFEVSIVEYEVGPGVILAGYEAPDYVEGGKDLDITFGLEKGYEWSKTVDCQVFVGDEDITADLKTLNLIKLNDDGGSITVPEEEITNFSDIKIVLNTQGITYSVTSSIGNNFTCTGLPDKVIHGTPLTTPIEFHPNTYYSTKSWDVTMDGTSVRGTVAKLADNKLTIDTNKVVGDLYVTAEAEAKKYDIKLNNSASPHLHFTTSQGTCEEDFSGQITVDAGYAFETTMTATCIDDATSTAKTFTIKPDASGNFKISKDEIHGPITITGAEHGITYNITYSITADDDHIKYDTTIKTVTHPNDFTNTFEADDNYHEFDPKTDTWDVTTSSGSLKGKGASFKDSKTLVVDGTKIFDNLTVSAHAHAKSWAVTPTFSDHMKVKTFKNATYGQTDYSETVTIDPSCTYSVQAANVRDAKDQKTVDITDKVHITQETGAKTLTVTIDKEGILGEISITFKEEGKKYAVYKHAQCDDQIVIDSSYLGADKAQFGKDCEIPITCKDQYYEVDTTKFVITAGSTTLIQGTDYSFANDKLTIEGDSITGDINILAKVKLKEFNVTAEGTGGVTLTSSGPAKYGEPYYVTYALDSGKTIDTSTVKCVVSGGETLLVSNGTLEIDTENKRIQIKDSTKIIGDLAFTASADTINVSGSITGLTCTGVESEYIWAPATLKFTVQDGYILNGDDFTNKKVKIYNGDPTTGTLIDPTNLIINLTDNTVTIKEGIISGKTIGIAGEITHYSLTVTANPEAAFVGLTKPDHATPTEFTISYTLDTTKYPNFSAEVKCGETTFEADTDYVMKSNGLTLTEQGAKKVTGPMTVALHAANMTIVGATNPFLATAHEIDSNEPSSNEDNAIQLTVKYNDTDVTSQCSFDITSGSKLLSVSETGKITRVTTPDYSSGTSSTVRATYNGVTVEYDVEVGSFNMLHPAVDQETKTADVRIKTSPTEQISKITVPKRLWWDNSYFATITGFNGAGNSYGIDLTELSSIDLPDSITAIGDKAFASYDLSKPAINLKSIKIPSSVTSIGDAAFQGCTGLTDTVEIPSGVTVLNKETFRGCTGLTHMDLPNITQIKYGCFYDCGDTFTDITLDSSKTWIISDTETVISSDDIANPKTCATNLKDPTEGFWGNKGIKVQTATKFEKTDWKTIVNAVETFENSDQSVTKQKELCSTFTDTDYISTGETVEDHLANFIGKTHTIPINGLDHTFRIIGINHDTLETPTTSGNTKALFTFEIAQLVSCGEDAGSEYARGFAGMMWDTSKATTYTNSTLYKALNTTDATTHMWCKGTTANEYNIPSMYYQLNNYFYTNFGLTNTIKHVKKQVAEKSGSWASKNYTCYCFPLSMTEYCQSETEPGTTYIETGSPYAFYTIHKEEYIGKEKTDIKGVNTRTYWTSSPLITGAGDEWEVYCWLWNDRIFGTGNNANQGNAVSFAFCI